MSDNLAFLDFSWPLINRRKRSFFNAIRPSQSFSHATFPVARQVGTKVFSAWFQISIAFLIDLRVYILIYGFMGNARADGIHRNSRYLFGRPTDLQLRDYICPECLIFQTLFSSAMLPVFNGSQVGQPRGIYIPLRRPVPPHFSRYRRRIAAISSGNISD